MRREPGQIMSSDATFSLAAITLSTGQMMVFLMGENADVVRWFVTRTESFKELKIGLLRLRDCLAASGKLEMLEFWWTDTCCEGCANTPEKMREHIICEIFPKMRRRPYGDSFHAVKLLTQACGSMRSRAVFTSYCKEVGEAFSQTLEPDILSIAVALQKRDRGHHQGNPQKYPVAEAIAHYHKMACTLKTWDYAKRSAHRSGEEIAATLDRIFQTYSQEDGWLRKDRPAIKKRGTAHIFENMKKCVLKGCFSDPLPTEQMYRCIGETKELGLKIYRYKGGSGKNETLHSALKRLMPYYSSLSETKMQRAIGLCIYAYNQSADVKNHLCDGAVGFAFVKMQLNELASGVLSAPIYPVIAAGPRVLNGDGPFLWKETQGFEYHTEMKRLDAAHQIEETIASFAPSEGSSSVLSTTIVTARAPAPAGAGAGAGAALVAGAATASQHRTAQVHVMPFVFEQPLADLSTKDQVELLAILLSELRQVKPNLTGAGPISRELATRYLQKFTLNAMLAEGDTENDWGYGLRGKLELVGIIDAHTIEKHYARIGQEAVNGRLNVLPKKRQREPGHQQLPAQRPRQMRAAAPIPLPITNDSPMATQVGSDPASGANDAATDLLQIANGPALAKAKPTKNANYRDRTREKANELISSKKWLKRKAANQFVVEGEEDRILGGTSQDVEVLRSYTKAAKKSKRGVPIKLGSRTGPADAQAKHLAQQLESFFQEHNDGSDSFTPK
jgi:hypothetical protein